MTALNTIIGKLTPVETPQLHTKRPYHTYENNYDSPTTYNQNVNTHQHNYNQIQKTTPTTPAPSDRRTLHTIKEEQTYTTRAYCVS